MKANLLTFSDIIEYQSSNKKGITYHKFVRIKMIIIKTNKCVSKSVKSKIAILSRVNLQVFAGAKYRDYMKMACSDQVTSLQLHRNI